jgi:hypothetical protein
MERGNTGNNRPANFTVDFSIDNNIDRTIFNGGLGLPEEVTVRVSVTVRDGVAVAHSLEPLQGWPGERVAEIINIRESGVDENGNVFCIFQSRAVSNQLLRAVINDNGNINSSIVDPDRVLNPIEAFNRISELYRETEITTDDPARINILSEEISRVVENSEPQFTSLARQNPQFQALTRLYDGGEFNLELVGQVLFTIVPRENGEE